MRDIQITFIGSGGKQPGIYGITSFGNMVRLADYGNGCSVYDLHYSLFDKKLTTGDRGGYVKQYWPDTDNNELVLLSEYNHGTPVVSVIQYNMRIHSAGLDG